MHPLLGLGLLAAAVAWLFDDRDKKMPAMQKQFEEFHKAICFDEDDEKATLREKRDTIIKALRDNLGDDVPSFTHFNQGSYSMHTGVVPLDGNFDIDVGLIFDCNQDKYPDPVVLKKKVRDAVNTNFRTVVIRRPCVTVNYVSGGETAYHAKLARLLVAEMLLNQRRRILEVHKEAERTVLPISALSPRASLRQTKPLEKTARRRAEAELLQRTTIRRAAVRRKDQADPDLRAM